VPSSAADIADSKRPGEYFDPCQEAAARSLKCLHRNGGDREMCTDYFQYVTSFVERLLVSMCHVTSAPI